MTELLEVPRAEEFSELVEQYEKKCENPDGVYIMVLREFEKRNLQDLSYHDVESVLRPYLLKWGKMGRVLGIRGCQIICDKLKELNPKFAVLRHKALLTFDLDAKLKFADIYDEIVNAKWETQKGKTRRVGPTSASKTLHLVAPDLFMIWDRTIRNYYGFQETGKEYLRFLVNMKNWLKKLKPTIKKLQAKYQKSSTKIIDEYNWIKCST
jgi:hypothetical protein